MCELLEDVLKEERAEARAEGLAEGLTKGRAEGANDVVAAVIRLKSGEAPETLLADGVSANTVALAQKCL